MEPTLRHTSTRKTDHHLDHVDYTWYMYVDMTCAGFVQYISNPGNMCYFLIAHADHANRMATSSIGHADHIYQGSVCPESHRSSMDHLWGSDLSDVLIL